jgi:hypothetical protein
MTETSSTRTSRSRRVVALMGWGCLVATAFLLWNARQTGSVRSVTMEPVAFLLAAFAAFVGVFAWMLYNPGRRSAAESPSLFFGAGATLFPPPIIGFCLMPIDSELRWWLALGLFLLCAIAILSHLPDEFFGVPRSRQTYLTPLPVFDRVAGTVLDPESSWFRFEDLSRVVSDTERPSLAPRSYLQREIVRSSPATRTELRAATAVDDILGSDFDLGLLDDALVEDDLWDQQRAAKTPTQRPVQQEAYRHAQVRDRQQSVASPVSTSFPAVSSRSANDALPRPPASLVGGPSLPLNYPLTGQTPYQAFNPESRYLVTHQQQRKQAARQSSSRRAVSRHSGPARMLDVTESGSAAARSAGGSPSVAQSARRPSSPASPPPVHSSSLPVAEADSAVRRVPRMREVPSVQKASEVADVSSPTTESRPQTSRVTAAASTSVSRTAHAAHTVASTAALSGGAFAPTQVPTSVATPQAVTGTEPAAQKTRQLFGQTLPQQREVQNRAAGGVDTADSSWGQGDQWQTQSL